MARTVEEREQWFKEFSKELGLGTNPKNAADALVDRIYVFKEGNPAPVKAFARNPFTYNSSPKQRQQAIESLMDAYETNMLLSPDKDGIIKPIGKENGKDFVRTTLKEPEPLKGSNFSRSTKKVINAVLPMAFKKDMKREEQYEKDMKRYKELKALSEKNKVSILSMAQAKKQQETEEKAELREKELDKDMKDFERGLQNLPGQSPERNVLGKKDARGKWELGAGKIAPVEPTDPDLKGLSSREIENLKKYTMTRLAAKGSQEDLKKYLMNPGRKTVGMAMLAEDAKAEYLQRLKEFKEDPANKDKEFTMDDPQETADAVKNLSTVMQGESKLSPMHRTAARMSSSLVQDYRDQKGRLPQDKQERGVKPFDLKFLESMDKMSAIYVEGMAAKKTLLGMDSLKQNTQERLDALAKVGAMESVSATLKDSIKSKESGMVNKKTGLTKQQAFFTSDAFTKEFMQQKAAKSPTIQNLAKDKPEDFHKKFLTLDDQVKMEKFGRTVNSEGSAAMLKSMMNKQTARANSIKKEIALNTPGINTPVKGPFGL